MTGLRAASHAVGGEAVLGDRNGAALPAGQIQAVTVPGSRGLQKALNQRAASVQLTIADQYPGASAGRGFARGGRVQVVANLTFESRSLLRGNLLCRFGIPQLTSRSRYYRNPLPGERSQCLDCIVAEGARTSGLALRCGERCHRRASSQAFPNSCWHPDQHQPVCRGIADLLVERQPARRHIDAVEPDMVEEPLAIVIFGVRKVAVQPVNEWLVVAPAVADEQLWDS